MNHLRSNRGETLVESLSAILVITVVFLFLCGAVVAAARSNEQVRKADQDFHYGDMTVTETKTMTVVDGSVRTPYDVTEYATAQKDKEEYTNRIYRRYTIRRAEN